MPIKVNLPDGRVVNFPDGMSQADIEAEVTKLAPPMPAGATEGMLAPSTVADGDPAPRLMQEPGRYLRETLSNVPSSAANLVVETMKGIPVMATLAANAAKSQSGIGPPAMIGVPDALVGMAKDRYGSLDAAENTFREDPVGLLGDVAAVGSVASAGVRGGIRAATGLAVPSLTSVTIDPVARAVGRGVQSGAEALYQTTLKPRTPKARGVAEFRRAQGDIPSITPAQIGIERGVIPTPEGVARAQVQAIQEPLGQRLRMNDLLAKIGKINPEAIKIDVPNTPLKQLVKMQQSPVLSNLRLKLNADTFIPDDLLALEAALPRGPKPGLLSSVPFGSAGAAGLAALLGYGTPETIAAGLAGLATKSPVVRGGAAIGMDRIGRMIPRIASPGVQAGLDSRLSDEVRRRLEEELLKRTSRP